MTARALDNTLQPAADEAATRLGAQLSESYGLLAARMDELQGQLARASADRQSQLAETERLAQRLQSLLDLLPGGVVVIDASGRVRESNPVARQLLGEPLLGEPWWQVIGRAFAPRQDDGHEVSLRDGRRVSIATRSLEGEPGQLVLLTDLTETRRLQEQLARHQRLSSLGRMVASLAHQIRTPLSAALLYASHLQEGGLQVEQQQRFAGRLKERLQALEAQVRDMLVFARGDLPLPDRISAGELYSALQRAAEPRLLGNRLRWQCDAGRAPLCCNRDTLVGALMNLLDNALQADPECGLKIHAYRRGERLRLCVSDDGPGIAPELLARLGEPFFTTRTTGTGLGLAVVKAVARAHGGELRLRSRPGRGTCALLELPLATGEPETTEARR